MRVLVAVTGASGSPLAVRLLEELGGAGVERHLIVSDSAWKVLAHEDGRPREAVLSLTERHYDEDDTAAPVCSGSYPMDAMVVIPCSLNTLSCIANGIAGNAITRAAAVTLKQERKLVLVPRETPLSLPALRNMVSAKEAGCSIVPPVLGYYHGPETVKDCTDFAVGKVLEVLGLPHDLYRRWGGDA